MTSTCQTSSCWLLIALAGASLAKTNPEVVVVAVANMHRLSDKTDVVSQAIYGSNVKLLEARGEWSKIQTLGPVQIPDGCRVAICGYFSTAN